MKGADPAAIVNKAAGYVALFAAASGANAKIPKADANKITEFMKTVLRPDAIRQTHEVKTYTTKTGRTRKVRRIKRLSKVTSTWMGTMAVALVMKLYYHGATSKGGKYYERYIRTMMSGGPKAMKNASEFYRVVRAFAGMRRGSAGYLRSGMYPAIKAFASKRTGIDKFDPERVYPGDASVAVKGTRRSVASMTNYAKEINRFAPNALKQAEKQVAAQYEGWVREGLVKAGVKAGFKKA